MRSLAIDYEQQRITAERLDGNRMTAAIKSAARPEAAYMRAHRMSGAHARLNAHACVLPDLQADLAKAASTVGLNQRELDRWLEEVRDGMARLPYIGRVEELVVYQRPRNGGATWERNHLNDMHFLCCAADTPTSWFARKRRRTI